MRITTTAQRSGKINLYADGDFRCSVPASLWFKGTLRDGDEVSEEELTALQEAAGSVFAYENALRYLSLRAHSEKELGDKLRRKYGAAAAKDAVEKCRALGLLDDEKFADLLARELSERKSYAPRRIEQELKSRGINRETAENTVRALDTDEKISMMDVIEKQTHGERPDEKGKGRLVNRLLRLGYAPHDIFDALSALGWDTNWTEE